MAVKLYIIFAILLIGLCSSVSAVCSSPQIIFNSTNADNTDGYQIRPADRTLSGGKILINGTGTRLIDRITWKLGDSGTNPTGLLYLELWNTTNISTNAVASYRMNNLGYIDGSSVSGLVGTYTFRPNVSTYVTGGNTYWVVGNGSILEPNPGAIISPLGADAGAVGLVSYKAIGSGWTVGNGYKNEIIVYGCDEILWVNPTPVDGAANNTLINIIFNATCDSGNINLYFDNLTNPVTKVKSNVAFTNWTINYTAESIYYYKAECVDSLLNSSIRTWTYDGTAPTITLNSGSTFNALNVTNNKKALIMNFTFADNILLHSVLINVTKKTTGVEYYSYTNESIDLSSFNFYKNVPINNLPLGTYKVSVWAVDGHTATEIDKYSIDRKASEIKFNTAEKNNITLSTKELSVITETKDKDRYSINVVYDKSVSGTKKTYYLESDKPIKYINDKQYKGWFVIMNWEEKTGNWIDFEGVEGKPTITKISDYKYEVVIEGIGSEVKFNSIGGLNVRSNAYEWINEQLYFDNCNNTYNMSSNATTLILNFYDSETLAASPVNISFTLTSNITYSTTIYGVSQANFCLYPNDAILSEADVQFNYFFTGSYAQYSNTFTLSNTSTYLSLYTFAGSANTIFTIIDDDSGLPIADVYGRMYKFVNGTLALIQSKYSDITGKMQFYYTPSTQYYFNLSKAGYEYYYFTLNPILYSEYSIPMSSFETSNLSYPYQNVIVNYNPLTFYESSNISWQFEIYSPAGRLSYYNYTLTYPTGGTTFGSGTQPYGETKTENFAITNPTINDYVYLDYCYVVAGYSPFCYSGQFEILVNQTATFMQNKNKTYGMGLVERCIIMVLFCLMCIGIAALSGQIAAGSILAGLVMGYMVFIGFVPLWLVIFPAVMLIFYISLGGLK